MNPDEVSAGQRAKYLPHVSLGSRERALQIIADLFVEAEARGFGTGLADQGTPGVYFTIDGQVWQLLVGEEHEMKEQIPSLSELNETKTYDWQRIQPQLVSTPTGRLTIELPEDYRFPGRPRRWADRSRWSLEQKIPAIVTEVAARAAIVAERRSAEEKARAERQAKWELAMATARDQFFEDNRKRLLLEQIASWNQARSISDYCDALDGFIERETDTDKANGLREWSRWARSHATEIDPFQTGVETPSDIEPEPEDLQPFLDGWSPYGPEDSPRQRYHF